MRALKWLAAAAIALVMAFLLGAVPLPSPLIGARAEPSAEPVRIYVLSNGFHSDIALPDRDGETLLRFGIDPADYPVDHDAVRYWAFGWGSKTAYTSLLEITDLTPGIAIRSLAFDVSVMHVLPLGEIGPREGIYAIDVSPAQYDRLVSGIRRSFGAEIRPIPDISQGYGDRYYEGEGRFSPLKGCNVWTGRRLRDAGIGVGMWTVFAQSLEFGLGRVSAL
ncbi:TIGR02117 family protein [Oricola sp.]|uniref:TIGR02117 family protein n=1 Tax=Oricola sp. TaxID=1979950 RepID=UPI003BA8FB5C